ncbi:MAG: putative CRISPR-associated protein, partial [Thermodesulfobacteriaceae bacterium]|nr:putative CRISPR-associated protein [Thermodesulfobacteriaceae bacterium]
MNKIITMVGTSIFENYRREKSDDAVSMGFFEDLKDIESEKWEDEIERCKRLKSCVNSWITKKINKELENISAEVKSLAKLSEELKDAFEIYLLSSDTILSRLAGEILKDVLPKLESFENAKIELRVIKGLQVKDRKKFNEGMSNLITEIYKIAGGSWDNVIINITGGYKATIPFLTILAQINRCLIYYIFEETDSLIQIPNIPLTE